MESAITSAMSMAIRCLDIASKPKWHFVRTQQKRSATPLQLLKEASRLALYHRQGLGGGVGRIGHQAFQNTLG